MFDLYIRQNRTELSRTSKPNQNKKKKNKTNVVQAINWAKYKIDVQKIQHDLTPYVYAIPTNPQRLLKHTLS